MTKIDLNEKMISITFKMDELSNNFKNGLISGYGYTMNYAFLNKQWEKYNALYSTMGQ